MRIAIIGAGAAGCFAAANLGKMMPGAEIHVYESKRRALMKVAITGGGRCNLTNSFARVGNLKEIYPRGDKMMRKVLGAFDHDDVMEWFRSRGVRLVVQDDECVFPESQDAMQIVSTLENECRKGGVKFFVNARVDAVVPHEGAYGVIAEGKEMVYDRVLVTTGGHPTSKGFEMLKALDLKVSEPVPSLFTFNVEGEWKSLLMGNVVENVQVSIAGTKLKACGPLLLTHWGMSGPAILKLSSHGARVLAEKGYKCQIVINWFLGENEERVRKEFMEMAAGGAKKLVTGVWPRHLSAKHWSVLLQRAFIPPTYRWSDVSGKLMNRLVSTLTADVYNVTGKCAFKEEFVTCGGVALGEVNPATMECRKWPGLFFAGEVLDVDAVTGGFNLQAAWSMGMVAARAMAKS